MDDFRVALTHAGSIATEAILEKLPDTGVTPDSVILLGDQSNIGSRLAYADSYLEVQNQEEFQFNGCALVLMPEYDNSIEERLTHLDTVLVSHCIDSADPAIFAATREVDLNISYTQSKVRVCNPELSCLLGVLPELHRAFEIISVNLVFLQSAESRGKAAIDELAGQTVALLNARDAVPGVYPLQIAFNMIPAPGFNDLNTDLPKLLGNCDINCIHQVIDVPAFHGFAAAVQLELAVDADLDGIKGVIKEIPKVYLNDTYSSPISDCNQSFSCVINRLEQVRVQSNSVLFWIVADPMRFGLANNYVNVTDILLKSFL